MFTVPNIIILFKVFSMDKKKLNVYLKNYINSNIDNDFTINNYAKFGYPSQDITVRFIWTTRSSHYIRSNMLGH